MSNYEQNYGPRKLPVYGASDKADLEAQDLQYDLTERQRLKELRLAANDEKATLADYNQEQLYEEVRNLGETEY